ncbi:MAG: M48 family metallopeptidase [Paracoccaceae bacterium]
MLRLLLPVILAGLWGWVMWYMAMNRMKRDLARNSCPIDDPALEAVVRRLGRQVGIEHLQANLYAMEAVNGLAAPDGRIFITSGLFDRYKRGHFTAQELGSVIAHELGHVARGHSRRRMIDWTGQNAARMALGMILSRFIPVIGYYIASFLASLLLTRLSRRDEFEADEYASALMVKAEIGTGPQIAMFEKLSKLSPGPAGVAWLASHPATTERIEAIRARAATWEDHVAEQTGSKPKHKPHSQE